MPDGLDAVLTAGLLVAAFWAGYVYRMIREGREPTADD